MFDMTYQVDPEKVSLCPLCDQPMMTYEKVTTMVVDDTQCMVHYDCVNDFDEEDFDDEEV